LVVWDVTHPFEGSIRGPRAEEEFDHSFNFLVFEVGMRAIEMGSDPVEGGLVVLEVTGTGFGGTMNGVVHNPILTRLSDALLVI
jgi:hypothetical protein